MSPALSGTLKAAWGCLQGHLVFCFLAGWPSTFSWSFRLYSWKERALLFTGRSGQGHPASHPPLTTMGCPPGHTLPSYSPSQARAYLSYTFSLLGLTSYQCCY